MAQLINMRQRIKAVETIRKITNAMRLISMSSHNKLKGKKINLENYIKSISQITFTIKSLISSAEEKNRLNNMENSSHKKLIILVSSEKGLAGNFNTQLFNFFNNVNLEAKYQYYYIGVGKFAIDFLKEKKKNIIEKYAKFNANNFLEIADKISNNVLTNLEIYNQIIVYSNNPKSFFIQDPSKTILFPTTTQIDSKDTISYDLTDYAWEQDPNILYTKLKRLQIRTNIQQLLFNSLLAEQSARFLSMDSSTRNAETLLNIMKVEYNKARQATITKELIELTGGFIA